MAIRTITQKVKQTVILKLSWKQIDRKRRAYPHESFTVYALMQSDGKMLGYIINEPHGGKDYWCCYEGDQRWARTSNLTISPTLEEAQGRLMTLFADEDSV